ncbi:uncharacterized protein [Haliotis asinina]|uniref:uncharacterized protein n=1 Tax=Haliotis asinina TaxID=109174 RepID=UPI0035323341
MGGIGSKVEMLDDGTGTPVKCQIDSRQLDDDPRSPTNNIPRTPIIVNKTPDGLLDPRSPTPGIWRTPINNFMKKDEFKSVQDDVKPLLEENTSPDMSRKHDDDETDKLDVKDDLGATAAAAAAAELQHMSMSDVDESASLLVANSKPVEIKKPKGQKTQPKKLFYDKKKPSKAFSSTPKSVLTSTPPRSPLSTVVIDTNSPRVIMHRKQTKKIDAARQCRLGALRSSQDKENVDM